MNPHIWQTEIHGIVLGNAQFGGLRVAYIELPQGEGRLHWVFAIEDGAATAAIPLAEGPLVPGRPMASHAEVMEILPGLVERSRSGTAATAIMQVLMPGMPAMAKMVDMLAEAGWQGEERLSSTDIERMEDWLLPLVVRLGDRLRILRAFIDADSGSAVRLPNPTLSGTEGCERIVRLTAAEAKGAMSLVSTARRGTSHYLPLAIREPSIALDGSPREVQAAVLRRMHVPEAALRRIPGDQRVSRDTALGLRFLPIDWIPGPEDLDGWRGLHMACRAMAQLHRNPPRWDVMAKGSKGNWPGFVDRCLKVAFEVAVIPEWQFRHDVGKYLPEIVTRSLDVNRAFEAYLISIQGDEGMRETLRARALAEKAIVGDRSLPTRLEVSREWHRRFHAPAPSGVTWQPILPRWTDPATGIEVVPLVVSDELEAEGDAMRHCVGGEAYALGSLRNELRIVSLRRDGKRLSTAEISMAPFKVGKEARNTEGVVQHLGPGNARPHEDAEACLDTYARLPETLEARAMATPGHEAMPRRSDADLESLLERWRPYLTGPWKSTTLAEFRAEMRSAPRPTTMRPEPSPGGPR